MLKDKLFKLRRKQGFSQQEVADLLNISRQTISNWEGGQGSPNLDKAIELSQLYKINLNDLIEENVEVIVKQTKKSDVRILKSFIGKECKIECYNYDAMIESYTTMKILDVDENWIKVEYKRNSLIKKETIIRLVDLDTIAGFIIKEVTT